ncbi:MAG: DUF2927 domain-containing protein [Pseudomonadota bacterium]
MSRLAGALGLAVFLAGCEVSPPVQPVPVPPSRPAGLAQRAEPSDISKNLQLYYARLENDLVARGLLRTDGGGPDTPFDADDLERNFETIVFFDEYRAGAGLSSRGAGESGRLRRWDGPVRMNVEFGRFSTPQTRTRNRNDVAAYAARLARVTGHPISVTSRSPNFNVFFMSYDDDALLQSRLRAVVPNISDSTLAIFRDLPRTIHCLVVAFSDNSAPQSYTRAVALIRAEHPDLIRRSCIHEELAQGLGLANDSPAARPSIFNDDDEFALLTTHDEFLLQMLYDPRLTSGMTASEARGPIRVIARGLLGQDL